MQKTKPVVARTPEALAQALGLSGAESQEWQVQHALLKKLRQVVREGSLTHAEVPASAGVAERGGSSRTRVTAIQRESRQRLDGSADPAPERVGLPREGFGLAHRLRGIAPPGGPRDASWRCFLLEASAGSCYRERTSRPAAITLPAETLERLEELARQENRSVQELLDEAVRRYESDRWWDEMKRVRAGIRGSCRHTERRAGCLGHTRRPAQRAERPLNREANTHEAQAEFVVTGDAHLLSMLSLA